MHWQRRRDPELVPTPVAVAVADFCRRADAPATPAEVREALSAVGEEDDFRVRQQAERDPPERPLGPFALVELVHGVPPDLAAQRQRCGYYELARDLLADSEPPVMPRARPESRPARAAKAKAEPKPKPKRSRERNGKPEKPTVAERIAPRKKAPAAIAPSSPPAEPDAPAPQAAPRRQLPQPRGRFTRLEVSKAPLDELFRPESRELLLRALRQHGHRAGILRALAGSYLGRDGQELTLAELDAALARHQLLEEAIAVERTLLRDAFEQHQGAQGRVAWSLGVRPADLRAWVTRLGLNEAVEDLRERFRREALAEPRWKARFDLLGRENYLADLGIADRFKAQLKTQLREELQKRADSAQAPGAYQAMARAVGVPEPMVRRAAERLGLSKRPPAPAPTPSP